MADFQSRYPLLMNKVWKCKFTLQSVTFLLAFYLFLNLYVSTIVSNMALSLLVEISAFNGLSCREEMEPTILIFFTKFVL